ncbi:MAG: class I SAM-dependent methyltransferase [Tistlia sp.]|uniref:class I SAM-dependent methyltransferase n=1 Tax=Tistlia sp. TaxID=3057121 RepID=UPI0034A42145
MDQHIVEATPAAAEAAKLEAFVGKAVSDLAAGYAGVMVALGHKLGLYRALLGAGPLTSEEVARRSGCAERYVREWLNAQAAAGYLDYHAVSASYELGEAQAMVLAREDSPVFLPPAWEVPASMWFDEARTLEAFRTGGGVAWGEHDARLFCGVAAFYRNGYRASLVAEWLPALAGVVEKLSEGGQVADIGCGHGHSTIFMAQAFPKARFRGFDGHPASIEAARANAAAAGVADRVTFEVARADAYPSGPYDLICFFDCLHDMGRPVEAARHAARTLAPDGTVMLVEPFANDRVEDNLNVVGQLYYAASATLCCAHAISEQGSHVLGAQAGERRLAKVFQEGGFGRFRRAHQTPFNLIFEARI